MSNQNKISTQKVKRFVGMSLILLAFTALLIAANRKQTDTPIDENILVTLKNQDREENFLKVADVDSLIRKQGISVENESVGTLNLKAIENAIIANPWIKHAEVFVDNKNRLNIEVLQRLPVARVFDNHGNSFYLDSSSFEMPLSERYTYSVPVFTNYKQLTNDSAQQDFKKRIVYLSGIILKDTFWNNQITQIDIASENDFNFFTTIGKQKIRFGDTVAAHDKLNNLVSFYKEVSNKIGWDKYEIIDVRFKGQVVTFPSIGWVPPKDTIKVEAVAPLPIANASVADNKIPEPKLETKPVVKVAAKAPANSETNKTAVKTKETNKTAVKPKETNKNKTLQNANTAKNITPKTADKKKETKPIQKTPVKNNQSQKK